jgi:hypothetical protein
MAAHRKHLRTLSLDTDPDCTAAFLDVVDLTQFENLRSFAWRGIRGDCFDYLSAFVNARRAALTTLQLDFVDWDRVERAWNHHQWTTRMDSPLRVDNFFARDVLQLYNGDERVIFPSLTGLDVSAVLFAGAELEMAHAFHMRNLSRLKLWNCPSSLILLNKIVDRAQTPRLISFELTLGLEAFQSHLEVKGEVELHIARFLRSFHGLEDLSIMLLQPIAWDIVLRAIWHHRITLRRLTIHDRDIDSDEDSIVDGDVPWNDQRLVLYRDTRLSYIGTSGSPPQLVSPLLVKRSLAWSHDPWADVGTPLLTDGFQEALPTTDVQDIAHQSLRSQPPKAGG